MKELTKDELDQLPTNEEPPQADESIVEVDYGNV